MIFELPVLAVALLVSYAVALVRRSRFADAPNLSTARHQWWLVLLALAASLLTRGLGADTLWGWVVWLALMMGVAWFVRGTGSALVPVGRVAVPILIIAGAWIAAVIPVAYTYWACSRDGWSTCLVGGPDFGGSWVSVPPKSMASALANGISHAPYALSLLAAVAALWLWRRNEYSRLIASYAAAALASMSALFFLLTYVLVSLTLRGLNGGYGLPKIELAVDLAMLVVSLGLVIWSLSRLLLPPARLVPVGVPPAGAPQN